MEIWDGYNEQVEKIGVDLIRGEKIPEGVFHGVVVVMVVHEDGTWLLMKRDYNKLVCPGKWEAGASGCVQKGETFQEAAKRELFEETGIYGENLRLIDTYIRREYQTIYKIYLHKSSIDKKAITLQQGETIDFKWVQKDELMSIIDTDNFASPWAEGTKNIIHYKSLNELKL